MLDALRRKSPYVCTIIMFRKLGVQGMRGFEVNLTFLLN